jgi:putative ABC transport system permease protein
LLAEKPRILVSDGAARRLGLKVGSELPLHTPAGEVRFEVRGIVTDYASGAGSGFIDRQMFVKYWGDTSVDAVSVYLAAGASADAVSDAIRKTLGQSTIFVTTTSQVHDRLLDSLSETFSYSRSIEWITLLIALLGVVGTMLAAVIDRTREIATLRAIGASPGQVAAAIVVEAGFLGFCAVVVGVVLGVAECFLFLRILVVADTGWQLTFVFPWWSTARIATLAIVTSMLAGGVAALRAARTDVVGSVVYE